MPVLLAVLTFAAALVYDYVEALYTRAAAELDETRAPLLSVVLYGIGCIGFYVFLKVSPWYMLPEVAGLYCGTRLAVRTGKRRQQALRKA